MKWKDGVNIYTCGGHSMKAISRDFAAKLSWPKQVPEDAYTYLRMKELRLSMMRNHKAVAYMRSVTNLNDRRKQVNKFRNGRKALEMYFPKVLLDKEYDIPIRFVLIFTLKALLINPFWISLYLFEVILNRLLTFTRNEFNPLYEPYYSSKHLKINP